MGIKLNPFTGKLDVVDSPSGDFSDVELDQGTATAPSISFNGDPTGIYSPSADQVAISTNGTGRLFIDASGNVGIGTTSPDTKLDVNGAFFLRPTSETFPSENGVGLRLRSDINHLQIRALQYTPSIVYYDIDYLGLKHAWSVNGSEKMQLDSFGRLLVGTSSTSASTRAVLQGNSSSSTGPASLFISAGTSTPSSGASIGLLRFSDSNHAQSAEITAFRDGGTWTSGSSQPTGLVFSTTPDGDSSPDERMRIDSSGSVLINTESTNISSNEKLTVNGISTFYRAGTPVYMKRLTNNGDVLGFYRDSTAVGSVSVTTTATSFNTSSDYRLKENIVPLTNAADRVNQLQVHRFNFIADPATTVDGFIAHEAQAVVPECVTGTKDEVDDEGNPVYQGIDQSKIVPLVVAALQEALTEIEKLKTRLADAGIS